MKNKLIGPILLMLHAATISAAVDDKPVWNPDKEKAVDLHNSVAVIFGHGEALPEEIIVRLYKFQDGVGEFVATDTIADGKFRFEIPVGEGLSVFALRFDYHAFPTMMHKLFLTPGAVLELEALDNNMFTWPVKSNVPEQTEYELFIDNSKDLWKERQDANIEYYKKGSRNAYEAIDSLNRVIYRRDIELLKTRPVGTIWMDKALSIATGADRLKIDTKDLKAMYANLDDSIKNSPDGRALYGYLFPEAPIGIGDKFPDTEFSDLDGNIHKFSEFQGKWCLVDFWNSGCSPCIRALPELRELKEKYPDTLEIVSLSIDSDNIWRKASEELNFKGNNWNEGKKDYGIFRRLGTSAYPTFLIIDPDGIIKDLWIGYGTGDLNQKINNILTQ